MAAGWLREREVMWEASRTVSEWLVDRLDPKPGETILELAAGVGDTGFLAAQQVGSEGRLISTDFAPAMVDAARERGAELGFDNVEYRVMDAERMDIEDGAVDGVVCRWGYMLFADLPAALRETRRVLRAGARLCFAVWAGAERNPWSALAGATMVELGHMPMPQPGDPGIFSLGDPERIRQVVTEAGFSEPEIEQVPVTFSFEDFEQYWRFLNELAGGISRVIAPLPESEQETIRQLLGERLEPFAVDGGYRLPGLCNCVATK
jgi:ubiquinone/menaquinone biosynthesis C-methylase UbiE